MPLWRSGVEYNLVKNAAAIIAQAATPIILYRCMPLPPSHTTHMMLYYYILLYYSSIGHMMAIQS